MLGTSICPHCDATFNIGEPQLEAKLGLVRCGRCLEIFDFRISYIANQPSPQLELPISDEHALELDFTDDPNANTLAEPPEQKIIGYSDFTESHEVNIQATSHIGEIEHLLSDNTHDIETLLPIEFDDIETLLPVEETQPESPHSAKELVIKPAEMEEPHNVDYEFSSKSSRIWPWAVASTLFLLALLVQTTYFFRVDLAAISPATKPFLISACEILKCTVPLPQNANLISIESSGLEDAPQNHVVLNALLRNHATYAQTFPSLELTLTDTQDNPQARRIFKPTDYISSPENEAIGLLPNHEINIKLHLDTMDIKPSGYRLVLFYPQ
jgi:predicted Zn finger-like uncharacterized protein